MKLLSKHHYETLLYWAKLGVKEFGQAYLDKHPSRKDPYEKIIRNPAEFDLECLGDSFSFKNNKSRKKQGQEILQYLDQNKVKTKNSILIKNSQNQLRKILASYQ